MFGDLLSAVMQSTYSLGNQMNSDANLAIGLAQSQTSITQAWTGDPNIDWHNVPHNTQNNQPLPQSGQMYATYSILAVINYIAGEEQGESDQNTLQEMEAARSTWSNLINASGNEKDLQTQPFQTMSSGESSEINNTQSMLQGQGSFNSLIGDLSGETAQLISTL